MPLDDLPYNTKTFSKQSFHCRILCVSLLFLRFIALVLFRIRLTKLACISSGILCLLIDISLVPSLVNSAEFSGWEPSATMSAPNSSRPLLSPEACLCRASSPCFLGIKAHQIPDISIKKQDLPSHYTTTTTTPMNKDNIKSGITFFPEYIPTSTAALRTLRVLKQILDIFHSCTSQKPWNRLPPRRDQACAPGTLCGATACLAVSYIATASNHRAPPS